MAILTEADGITEGDFKSIEKFFICLYSRTCNLDEVNIAHRMLFTHGNRSIDNISLTSEALKQHVLRATLQAIREGF